MNWLFIEMIPKSRNILILLLLITPLFVCAYGPVIYTYFHHIQAGRTYLGFGSLDVDALGYLTLVGRGYAGDFLKRSIITTTIPGYPALMKTEYLLIGHLARIFNLDHIALYRFSVFAISTGYLLLIWVLIRSVFRKPLTQYLALFLVLYPTGIIIPGTWQGWEQYRFDFQVFQRTTLQAPHYMLASIFSLISLYLLSVWFNSKSSRVYLFSCVSGFLTSQFFAPAGLMNILTVAVFTFFYLLTGWKNLAVNIRQKLLPIVIYASLSGMPFIYLKYLQDFYDHNTFAKSEFLIQPMISWLQYPWQIIGLVFFPAIIGVYVVFRKSRNIFLKFAAVYILIHPFALIYIKDLIHINTIRFLQVPYYVFYGLLAAYGLESMISGIKPRYKKLGLGLIGLSLLVMLGVSIHTYKQSLVFLSKIEISDSIDLGYPKNDDLAVLNWIRNRRIINKIILSDTIAGMQIQALTFNRAYATLWLLFQRVPDAEIMANIYRFYYHQMSDTEAREFLFKNNIDYVFVGGTEWSYMKSSGLSGLPYTVLKPVYAKGESQLYEVVK